MSIVGLLLLLLFAAAAGVMLLFRRELARALREPVLRNPVLIIESDDWGFGPVEQARRLQSLVTTLTAFRDGTGRCPVMTIGVVLAWPDTSRIRSINSTSYASLTLQDEPLAPVRE